MTSGMFRSWVCICKSTWLVLCMMLLILPRHVPADDILQENSVTYYEESVYESILANDINLANKHTNTLYLSFTPTVLSLSSSVCVSKYGLITIQNMHTDRSIRIISVSSNDIQFRPLNYRSTYLAPSSSLQFNVSYLPRSEGNHKSMLSVKTSDGEVNYTMTGQSIPSIYGINPHVNIRVNVGIIPLIIQMNLTNPHSDSLKVLEVASSSRFVSIKPIPMKSLNDGFGVWDFKPNQTKEVLTAVIETETLGFYTGYVDIKTNYDIITVPVEVKVVEGGILSVPEILDFGSMLASGQRDVTLRLANTGDKDLLISNIYLEHKGIDPNIYLSKISAPIVIAARTQEIDAVAVATLTYSSFTPGEIYGRVTVTTNDTEPSKRAVFIAYKGNVLQGGVGYDMDDFVFYVSPDDIETLWEEDQYIERQIFLTNHFHVDVLLHAVYTECPAFVELHDVESGIAESLHTWSVTIRIWLSDIEDNTFPFKCFIGVHTSISDHKIPLHLLDSKLSLSFYDYVPGMNSVEQSSNSFVVNASPLWTGESRPLLLLVLNQNPVPMMVSISFESPYVHACVCYELSWPYENDHNLTSDQFAFSVAARSLSSSSEDMTKCSCSKRSVTIDGIETIQIYPNYYHLFSVIYENITDIWKFCESTINYDICSFKFHVNVLSASQSQKIRINYPIERGRCMSLYSPISIEDANDVNYGDRSPIIGQVRPFLLFITQDSSMLSCPTYPITSITIGNSSLISFEFGIFPLQNYSLPVEVILWQGLIFPVGFWDKQPQKTFWQQSIYLLRSTNHSNEPPERVVAMGDLIQKLLRIENPSLAVITWQQSVASNSASALYQYQMFMASYSEYFREVKSAWRNLFPYGISYTTIVEVLSAEFMSIHTIPYEYRINSPLASTPDQYAYDIDTTSTDEVFWVFIEVVNPFTRPIAVSLVTNDILTAKQHEINPQERDTMSYERPSSTSIFSWSLNMRWRRYAECQNQSTSSSSPGWLGLELCHQMKHLSFDQNTGDIYGNQTNHHTANLVQGIHLFSIVDNELVSSMRNDIAQYDSKYASGPQTIYAVTSDCDAKNVASGCGTSSVLNPSHRSYLGPIVIIPQHQKSNKNCKSYSCRQTRSADDMKYLNSETMFTIINNYTGLDYVRIGHKISLPQLTLTIIKVSSKVNASDNQIVSLDEYEMNQAPYGSNDARSSTSNLSSRPSMVTIVVQRYGQVTAEFRNDLGKAVIITDIMENNRPCHKFSWFRYWNRESVLCSQLPITLSSEDTVDLKLSSIPCTYTEQIVTVTLYLQTDDTSNHAQMIQNTMILAKLHPNAVRSCLERSDHSLSGVFSTIYGFMVLILALYCVIKSGYFARDIYIMTSSFKTNTSQAQVSVDTANPITEAISQDKTDENTSDTSPLISSITSQTPPNLDDVIATPILERNSSRPSRNDLALDWHPSSDSLLLLHDEKHTRNRSDSTSNHSDSLDTDNLTVGVSIELDSKWQQMNSPAKMLTIPMGKQNDISDILKSPLTELPNEVTNEVIKIVDNGSKTNETTSSEMETEKSVGPEVSALLSKKVAMKAPLPPPPGLPVRPIVQQHNIFSWDQRISTSIQSSPSKEISTNPRISMSSPSKPEIFDSNQYAKNPTSISDFPVDSKSVDALFFSHRDSLSYTSPLKEDSNYLSLDETILKDSRRRSFCDDRISSIEPHPTSDISSVLGTMRIPIIDNDLSSSLRIQDPSSPLQTRSIPPFRIPQPNRQQQGSQVHILQQQRLSVPSSPTNTNFTYSFAQDPVNISNLSSSTGNNTSPDGKAANPLDDPAMSEWLSNIMNDYL